MRTRVEHEAIWREKYAKWNIPVVGKPLHEQVKLWKEGDEAADKIIDEFLSKNLANKIAFREVEFMIDDGPFFPGNHPDFDKLPEGLACTMCPAFHGVVNKSDEELTVMCEWPEEVQRVSMRLDTKKDGGAVEQEGYCEHEYGISKI